MSNKEPVLRAKNLGIHFAGLRALSDFNIDIYPGEIVGLIGPNGAGKTTVFNLLTNVYEPTEGSITLHGHKSTGIPTHMVTRLGIARTFQNIRLFSDLTVLENVMIGLHNSVKYSPFDAMFRFPSYWKQEDDMRRRAYDLLGILDLQELAEHKAGSLPYGAQRRLEIVRALATKPKLLLLDEPAAGMNPSETQELMHNIHKIRDRFGISVFLIEHDMSLVMGICERIIVLNYGQIIAKGTPDEISQNPVVIEAYLGSQREES